MLNLEDHLNKASEIAIANEFNPDKQITLSEYKKYMGQMWTIRLQTVEGCGHKFHPINEPTMRNCEYCWFAYFQVHGENTQLADQIFQKDGRQMLVRVRGKKYVEMFLKFMATLAQFQGASQAQQQEKNESITGTSESSGITESNSTDGDTSRQVAGIGSGRKSAEQAI